MGILLTSGSITLATGACLAGSGTSALCRLRMVPFLPLGGIGNGGIGLRRAAEGTFASAVKSLLGLGREAVSSCDSIEKPIRPTLTSRSLPRRVRSVRLLGPTGGVEG
jgi:hypothetical protein